MHARHSTPRRGILALTRMPLEGPCKHLHEFEGTASQSTRPDANGYPARGTYSCFGISIGLRGQRRGRRRGGQFFLNQEREWTEFRSNPLCACANFRPWIQHGPAQET